MQSTGYHHAALTVRDLDVSASWYERLLDLEVVLDERGEQRRSKVYRIAPTASLFGLVEHSGRSTGTFDPSSTGLDHLAFSVAGRADIDDWQGRLEELGIEHSTPVDLPLGTILNFRDPDGIQLAVFWTKG